VKDFTLTRERIFVHSLDGSETGRRCLKSQIRRSKKVLEATLAICQINRRQQGPDRR
jgi:hypothetical protein